MKGKRKLMLVILSVMVFILAIGLWRGISHWRNVAATATEATDMKTVVERGDLDVVISGTGTIEAEVRKEVRAALGRTLARYDIDEGITVETG